MSVLQTVLIFVLAPLGLLALIYLPIAARSRRRRPRYRPGQPWHYPAQWWTASTADAGLPPLNVGVPESDGIAPRVGGGASGNW